MTQPILTWYGHSNVLLSAGGINVLIDPFFDGNPQAPDWKSIPRPDIIAVTHDHGDHLGQAVPIALATGATVACIVELAEWFQAQGVKHVLGWNIDGTVEAAGVRMTLTQAFHSTGHGVPVGFVFEMPDGFTAYHAGDTGLFGDMHLIGERFALDLAMLPVGGYYTMDGAQAARACSFLGARSVVPIHYGTFGLLAQTPDDFVRALQVEDPACQVLLPKPGIPFSLPHAAGRE